MGYTHKAVVVGAGISGLACAYRLKQQGIYSLVLESEERAGGLIATIRRNGFLFEAGPQCPRFPASVWGLVRELNLDREFVAGDPKAKRYILGQGRLHRAPFSPVGLVATRLVGFPSKLRILTEAFRYSKPPAYEESLAGFVERKFGRDVLDNLVDPFVSTIFFGDAHKMGMKSAFPALVDWERKYGSVVRGAIRARKSKHDPAQSRDSSIYKPSNTNRERLNVTDALPSLGSFHSGMGRLPERLAEELREMIRYRTKIESVASLRNEDSKTKAGWQIRLSGGEEITAEVLILAVPSYSAARLMESSTPQLGLLLNAIEYEPICVVSSAYQRSQVSLNLDGFGFMVPRVAGLNTICTFWNSSLFAGHAPEEKVLMTSFSGRDSSHALVAMSDQECASTVEAENAAILGIRGQPVDRMVWKYPRALPQYNVGHAHRVGEIHAILRGLANLRIVGNFLGGRSIGDCVDIAFRAADDACSHLGG